MRMHIPGGRIWLADDPLTGGRVEGIGGCELDRRRSNPSIIDAVVDLITHTTKPYTWFCWEFGSESVEVRSRFSSTFRGSDAISELFRRLLSFFMAIVEKVSMEQTSENSAPLDSYIGAQWTFDASSKLEEGNNDAKSKVSMDDLDLQGTGILLPDDEEALLSGIMDDLDLNGLPSQLDELEDYDLFGSVGGMELDSDPMESLTIGIAKANISDGFLANGISQYGLPNGVATISGEHPYGEHPSRTLFVRNINSNVEDSELRSLFEVSVCYQSPEANAKVSVFHCLKQIRETPHKRHHKFIEFYDVRAAEAALRSLNKSDIAGKRIKLEPSRPGGARRKYLNLLNSLMQQLTHELEHDETRVYRHHGGSPIANSPPGIRGYTSKMLLAAIDETHKGTYDFLYLPIDFKAFHGKKWEKFNSEKVASLAYARIQGRAALIAHFQNSSLMNEDKRCRPILFDSEGAEAGYQVKDQ
ncbi:hypothetical protein BHE74_00030375 [Ensete ventricosum]|nr:hypothetical protein BHE74_00030375 [Ensete ventricosum]